MAYQVVKGWPCEGAIDELLTAADGVTLTLGTPATINASGEAIVGDYDSLGSDSGLQAAFVIDYDEVRGKYLGLLSACVIEMDADHYAADTYAPNDTLTAIGGVLAKPTDSEPVLAKVLSVDATSDKIRVLWTA